MSNKPKRKKRKRAVDKTKVLTDKLKSAIENFLNSKVKKPALETVDKEFTVQQDIAVVLLFFQTTETLILDHGEDLYLEDLKDLSQEELMSIKNVLTPFINNPDLNPCSKEIDTIVNKQINKRHLLSYLIREIEWIAVSILSASYISSLILIRSIFELLIGIATYKTGSMSERIESIKYLSEEEQKSIKKCWNKLNSWAHPYGKWEKNVCPIFYSYKPIYHPTLYNECITALITLTDLYLTIATERFKISPLEIKDSVEKKDSVLTINFLGNLPLFSNKIIACDEGTHS